MDERSTAASDAAVITGPTASGKTELALDVAAALPGEIISMDSRQVYRGMDIGTAKATLEQRARVPHHGVDLVDPDQRYSVGAFARDARRWITEIRERERVPLLVGGTGFFLRGLTHPLFREPPLPAERREALSAYLDTQPIDRLRRWLQALDPQGARGLASRRGGAGRQRIARALEIPLLTGHTLAWWQTHSPADSPPLNLLIFVLELPRDELYRRIDERVIAMFEAGLIEEVERLLEEGYEPSDPGMNATGYAELVPYFRAECTREQALDAIQRATRRYARRQLTWLRHQLPPGAVRLDATAARHELMGKVIALTRKEVL